MVVNQNAIDIIREHYGDEGEKFVDPNIPLPPDIDQTGVCGTCYRYPEQDIIYPPEVLR